MTVLWNQLYIRSKDVPPIPPNVSVATVAIGWRALGPGVAVTSLALIVLSLRWYTKLKLTGNVGPDDFLISLSMVGRLKAKLLQRHGIRSTTYDGTDSQFRNACLHGLP
jgi:hypothetical protein